MVEIVWTAKAQSELEGLLMYWKKRNQSNIYSLKLNALFQEKLQLLAKMSYLGRKTDIQGVYVKIIREYLLFYEIVENKLVILTIRDSRQNPQKLKLS